MIISLSDIKLICNYTENKKPSTPQGCIYYMDNISSEDEWVINEHKRRNRQNAINSILDEDQEKYNDSDYLFPYSTDGTQTGSIRLMSQNVMATKFIDIESLYNDIILKLDNITSNPVKKCDFIKHIGSSLDVKLSNDSTKTFSENSDINSRRIITKITFISNLLTMRSRVGPPTALIIGDKILEYLLSTSYGLNLSKCSGVVIGNIHGTQVIHSDKINKNKVIAIRSTNDSSTGLNVINNVNNGEDYYPTYFIAETPTFENRICWFEII